MADVRGRTFTGGEEVRTDDTSFVDCTFNGASLRYAGGALPRFEGCNFLDATWYFEDAALRTIQLLQAFANEGDAGRTFVEWLFEPGNYLGA